VVAGAVASELAFRHISLKANKLLSYIKGISIVNTFHHCEWFRNDLRFE